MRRLSFKLVPAHLSLFYDWRVYRAGVPSGFSSLICGFTIRKDLSIENCTILAVGELGNYIENRKEKFLIALKEAWNNDELEFTVDL